MNDAWKVKNREIVFNAGRRISPYLGDIAQNDMVLTSLDLANEMARLDSVVAEIEAYRQLIIANIEPVK